jgi:hypothetical protein
LPLTLGASLPCIALLAVRGGVLARFGGTLGVAGCLEPFGAL